MKFPQLAKFINNEIAKLSIRGVGAKVGVSGTAISKWKTGNVRPNLRQLAAINKAYGIDASTLVGGDSDINPHFVETIVYHLDSKEDVKRLIAGEPTGKMSVNDMLWLTESVKAPFGTSVILHNNFGDIYIVSREDTLLQDGKRFLFKMNENNIAFRDVTLLANGGALLESELGNQESVTKDALGKLTCLGRVLWEGRVV